jgi:SDR family mycofactocin-dependent oxidoreductase
MGKLSGKVALITGAARGQGRAHAVRLAKDGADIIACDICGPVESIRYEPSTLTELNETRSLVMNEGQRAIIGQVDIRDLASLEAFVGSAVEELGHLEIVVANAGVLSIGPLWEITESEWAAVIGVNLTGVWHTIKATVPRLLRQGTGGSIILTSSGAGTKGFPFIGHYTASKHGVIGLCRTLANELGEYDIRVNAILPAGVNTAMGHVPRLEELLAEHQETLAPIYMNALPHDHMDHEDVSAVVAFLAGDDSRYMTGAQVPIDFGTLNR